MSELDQDPVVRELRERISAADTAILQAVNRRLVLVARLKDYKASQGYGLVDQAREAQLVAHLAETNSGPLSSDGLRELFAALLDLTKRELEIDPRSATPETPA